MSYSRNIKDYSIKKCKNFGYTFSTIFSLLSIYSYFVVSSFFIPFVILTLSLFLLTKFHPQSFKFLGFYWEKLGYFLGKFFSPIILLGISTPFGIIVTGCLKPSLLMSKYSEYAVA